MPTINELQQQIDELKSKLEEDNETIKKQEDLIKNHFHLGGETQNIIQILKQVPSIDVKKYKVAGTDGYNGTISVRKGDDSAACNLVFTNGILTSTTC